MKARGILVALAIVAVIVAAFIIAEPASSSPKSGTYVKLYSGGVLVGEWEALEPYRVEGEMYVFKVKDGSKEGEVRINGTFSIEAYD